VSSNEEFEAPQWVRDDANPEIVKEPIELTQKQKYFLIGILCTVIPLCLLVGWYEFGRAKEGHWRAWVYTFEWPFFAGVSIYMYRRIMRGDIPRIPRPD
jgi:hypothetical protein